MYNVKINFKRFFFRVYKCYSGYLGYAHRIVGKTTQITGMNRLMCF